MHARILSMRLPVLGLIGSLLTATAAEVRAQPALLEFSRPGLEPEVLAPGVVSLVNRYEYCAAPTADGTRLYYGVAIGARAEIRVAVRGSDGAVRHERVLSHPRFTFGDPMLSHDERRLYFISDRPHRPGDTEPTDYDIWYIDRSGDGWSEPMNLGSPINSRFDEYFVSFDELGRIFFASNRGHADARRDFDIYVAEPGAGGYSEPSALGAAVNSDRYEADPLVSRDGRTLVFGSIRPGGLGQGDLYVSRADDDGEWGEAQPLGPSVNTEGHELCPQFTRDGRFFIYTSREDLYWVDVSLLGASSRR